MSPDDGWRIAHMIEAGEQALTFIAGRRRADLDTDAMLRLALTRAVEIVGEAANQVSDAGRSELSSIPWQQIIGMRNRLVHAYSTSIATSSGILYSSPCRGCSLN